jgi:signal transduction histidine kinase
VEFVERIGRDGLHAGEVIRSLRSLIRKSAPAIAAFDFNAMIREVLEMMRAELRRGDVLIEPSLWRACHPSPATVSNCSRSW